MHVKLRLRRPNKDDEFIPFNQVLDTMLHELCHNSHGPHNASFYNLWDELRKVNVYAMPNVKNTCLIKYVKMFFFPLLDSTGVNDMVFMLLLSIEKLEDNLSLPLTVMLSFSFYLS